MTSLDLAPIGSLLIDTLVRKNITIIRLGFGTHVVRFLTFEKRKQSFGTIY
jgi:hypothetical protein